MENNYLIHHGIKGMKWGVRRYQNKDGTLTNAGKKRGKELNELKRAANSNPLWGDDISDKGISSYNKIADLIDEKSMNTVSLESVSAGMKKYENDFNNKKQPLIDQLDSIPFSEFEKRWEVDSKIRDMEEQYIRDVSSQILKDIGYEDTKRGREYIYSIVHSTKEFYR